MKANWFRVTHGWDSVLIISSLLWYKVFGLVQYVDGNGSLAVTETVVAASVE